ncbi:MAG: tellurite resistance/C4-dicarboxylate transporter family protein [Thermoleophilia bacterium]|nr:tellurite resistance/C4-dicarboxylate transporter family protein [Thermoleophilia bacterium]GIK76516.1 MAG: C4-dicarboxylate transporter [Actinomycetes bacterium]
MAARVDRAAAGLSPSYFALVMATGIVSVGAHLLNVDPVAIGLFAFNAVAYVVLWMLTIVRIARHRDALIRDLTDHRVAFGFFTTVAGTCVLGTETILIADHFEIATVLLAIAAVLWVVLTYTVFTAITIKPEKPSLPDGINGGWLLSVVATQSIAVLTALLAAHWGQPLRMHANFAALSMWLWGGMLYIWIVALIFYRYTFFRFSPADLAPPYWINMGAMAISTLAGALLIRGTPDAPFLESLRPFLEGFTVFYWATGTWWIPMIAILAVWRYGFSRLPLVYNPLYWGAVFPLGMYAVATYMMEDAMDFGFLDPLPQVFFAIALAAWLLTASGLVRSLRRGWRAPTRSPGAG